MNITIAIADTDRDYLERLVEVLQEYMDLSISVFTSARMLEQALENKRFDIVLFDPDLASEKVAFFHTKAAICLYSEEAENTALYAECDKVIKYQRISKIYKDLMKVYADKAGYIPEFDSSQNTKLFAVYSPSGGSGKTTMALSMANMLSSQGEEVLFLSMEQLDSSSCVYEHSEEVDGITALLEAMDDNTNFGLKLKGITRKGFNGISYVEGFERIVDYNSVSGEETGLLLEKIARYGNYGIVIVDMQSRLDEIGQSVFEKADKIILVENSGETSERKLAMFLEQALAREHVDKMFKIMNFTGNAQVDNNLQNIPVIASIPNYGNQRLKNLIQMISSKAELNIHGLMGRR